MATRRNTAAGRAKSMDQAASGSCQEDASPDRGALLPALERGVKGRLFYAPGHAAQQALLDRCWRTWHGALRHSGRFTVEMRRGELRCGGADSAIEVGHLRGLAHRFQLRALARVTFQPEFDAASLTAFVDLLATPPEQIEAAGGVGAVWASGPHRGIDVEVVDYAGHQRRARALAPEDSGEAPLVRQTPDVLAAPLALLPVADGGDPDAGLRELLKALDACREDERYRELALQVAAGGAARVAESLLAPAREVLTQFARHAGREGGRSAAQRETARSCVVRLVAGDLLEDVLEQACRPDSRTALGAIRILLELGPTALDPLFDRWEAAESAVTRDHLAGILVAIGEGIAPALEREIRSEDSPRRRTALRFAGETQNSRLVPCLRDVLFAGRDAEVRDAASALSQIGNDAAFEDLVGALRSPRPEVVSAAVACLGRSGRSRFAVPLLRALERALGKGALGLAREIVRALGRVGGETTAPALGAVLARGGLLQRRRLRPLKLAAVAALTALSDERGSDILERAAERGDAHLRRAARAALAARGVEPAAEPAAPDSPEPGRGGPQ